MPEEEGSGGGAWRRWRSRRFVVVDASMQPTLRAGDRLLVDPAPLRRRLPNVGEIVVLRDPQSPHRRLVKRVATRDDATGTVSVLGDAAEASRDSRSFGAVSFHSIVGLVWYRYLPRERRGPIGPEGPSERPKP